MTKKNIILLSTLAAVITVILALFEDTILDSVPSFGVIAFPFFLLIELFRTGIGLIILQVTLSLVLICVRIPNDEIKKKRMNMLRVFLFLGAYSALAMHYALAHSLIDHVTVWDPRAFGIDVRWFLIVLPAYALLPSIVNLDYSKNKEDDLVPKVILTIAYILGLCYFLLLLGVFLFLSFIFG